MKALALDIIEHQERCGIVRRMKVEEHGDVRVPERADSPCLGGEARKGVRIIERAGHQHLERNGALEAEIRGQVNGAHTALPEPSLDAEAAGQHGAGIGREHAGD